MASAPVPSMENVTEIVTVVETVEVSDTERVVETIHTFDLLEVAAPEVITETVQVTNIVTEAIAEQVAETVQVIEIVTDEGRQGPPGREGAPGIAEEDIVYAKRLDMVNSDTFYRGEAQTGSNESDPVWRIRRVTMITVGELVDLSEEWADGEAAFVHKWADRASLNYV